MTKDIEKLEAEIRSRPGAAERIDAMVDEAREHLAFRERLAKRHEDERELYERLAE